jgi:hypothetical protein
MLRRAEDGMPHHGSGRGLAALTMICLGACSLVACRHSRPMFTMEYTSSAHPGYQHSTLKSGSTVYENDYAETPLLAINTPSSQMVGELDTGVEGEKAFVYAIPGQDPHDYVILAGEMYPLGIYRNIKLPPFDWRAAKFQKMEFAAQEGPAAHKQTSDPALIAEVIEALRDTKAAIAIPSDPATLQKHLFGLYLWSDQLPGIIYCPHVYFDEKEKIYLGLWNPTSPEWSPAGPRFSAWVTTKQDAAIPRRGSRR